MNTCLGWTPPSELPSHAHGHTRAHTASQARGGRCPSTFTSALPLPGMETAPTSPAPAHGNEVLQHPHEDAYARFQSAPSF